MARSAADAPATRQSQRRRPPRRAADADAQPEQQSPAQAAAPRSSARGRPWRGAAASQTLADISNAGASDWGNLFSIILTRQRKSI